jgi:hypothetical protein
MGYDTPKKLGDRETGGGLSLPIWINFMEYALKGVPVTEYPPPEGVVNVGGEWYYSDMPKAPESARWVYNRTRRLPARRRHRARSRSYRLRTRKSASWTCSKTDVDRIKKGLRGALFFVSAPIKAHPASFGCYALLTSAGAMNTRAWPACSLA